MEKKLNKWNLQAIEKGKLFSMLIIGSRRSGKSYMVKHLWKKAKFNKYYDFFLVFCNSGDVSDYYSEFVPGNLFFKEFDETILKRVFDMSEKYKNEGTPKKFLCLFDDSVGTNEKCSEAIMQIYATGRHHNVSIIFCSQRLFLTNTTARNNSDCVLIGKSKSAIEKKYIIDCFLNGSLDIGEQPQNFKPYMFYNELIKEYTINYNFIVLDFSNDNSNSFFDTVFYYKAP